MGAGGWVDAPTRLLPVCRLHGTHAAMLRTPSGCFKLKHACTNIPGLQPSQPTLHCMATPHKYRQAAMPSFTAFTYVCVRSPSSDCTPAQRVHNRQSGLQTECFPAQLLMGCSISSGRVNGASATSTSRTEMGRSAGGKKRQRGLRASSTAALQAGRAASSMGTSMPRYLQRSVSLPP
jgi:hypothetical protein